MLYKLGNKRPNIPKSSVFIAPDASLIGDVHMNPWSSVWFHAVLRADNEPIVIGDRCNVQDGSVLHADPGFPLTLGKEVTVGHRAILHGCTVGQGTLVGMGAVILNGAHIGNCCLIGANTLVTERQRIPDYSLVLGSPGKRVRQLTESEVISLKTSADIYVQKVKHYIEHLEMINASLTN